MVAKSHLLYVFHLRCQVNHHLLGRCYTREQQHMPVFQLVELHGFLWLEESLQLAIFQCGEEKVLIGIKVHSLGEHSIINGFKVMRTFCYYHNVGPGLPLLRLSEPSGRQQLIIYNESVIVYE